MDNSEEQNNQTYEDAFESGLIDTYAKAVDNGLLHLYEKALHCGDIGIQTADEVDDIFGIKIGRFKRCVSEFKTRPEYYIYRQFQYKCKKEKESHNLRIEIEALERSHTELREKYNDLKRKC
jgi:hypothetical protein